MNDVKFKVGDLVYVPSETTEVCWIEFVGTDKLILNIKTSCKVYIDGTNAVDMPVILPATQQNYELLSKLYPNVSFEPPPKRKEPKEIIKAMLDFGYHGVLCQIAMVDEDDDSIVRCYRYDYALEVLDDKIIFSHYTMYNDELKFVSPFHQKSGMEIVDFVNGSLIMENGEVVLE